MKAFQKNTHYHRIHAFSGTAVWFFYSLMNSCPKRLRSCCTQALSPLWERQISGTRRQPNCKSRLSAKAQLSLLPSSCLLYSSHTACSLLRLPQAPVVVSRTKLLRLASCTVLSSTPSLQTSHRTRRTGLNRIFLGDCWSFFSTPLTMSSDSLKPT